MKYNITIEDKNGATLELLGFEERDTLLLQRAFQNEEGVNVLDGLSNDEALPLVVSAYREMSYHPGVFEPRDNSDKWATYEEIAEVLKELCLYLIESLEANVRVYEQK